MKKSHLFVQKVMNLIFNFIQKVIDLILHSNSLVSKSHIGDIIFLSLVLLLGGVFYLIGGPWWVMIYMMGMLLLGAIIFHMVLLWLLANRLAILVVQVILILRKLSGVDDGKAPDEFRDMDENVKSLKTIIVLIIVIFGIVSAHKVFMGFVPSDSIIESSIWGIVTLMLFGYIAYLVKKYLRFL